MYFYVNWYNYRIIFKIDNTYFLFKLCVSGENGKNWSIKEIKEKKFELNIELYWWQKCIFKWYSASE